MEPTQLNQAIKTYRQSWNDFAAQRSNQDFFRALKPQAVGWKTTDLAEFDQIFTQLRDLCDQIHLGLINERWIATMHLKDQPLEWGIWVVKLMQRRPSSTDPEGLDHIDFAIPDVEQTKAILDQEQGMKWTVESNNPHCSWISIWFNNTEAKLRTDSVVDVCIAELQDVARQL